ncbi:MAG TPA: hypothetical protein VL172_01360 [Kofleriaceae bacterium]|nr:hypothetical protein [Kofleriaceae bacterium]
MTERRLDEALARVRPDWGAERTEAAWQGMAGKRRRRAVRRGAAAMVAAAAVAGGVYLSWGGRGGDGDGDQAPVIAGAQPDDRRPATLRLRSGDRRPATPEVVAGEPKAEEFAVSDGEAELEVMQFEPDVLSWNLHRGKARFKKAPQRRVEVAAGPVRIIARASDFSVARYRDATEVWAVTGPVDVLLDERTHRLAPGEHRRFADPINARDDARRDDAPAADWRALAQDGRFADAYQQLRRGDPLVKIADLLLAADVYRLSGHPAEAIAPLQTVATEHSADPRAPLAAFTLGRVLLDDLGRPAAAARAFRRAGEVDPGGAMAEDALAREVEAWSKAGDAARARTAAERYLREFPRGHRLHAVKQYGGL